MNDWFDLTPLIPEAKLRDKAGKIAEKARDKRIEELEDAMMIHGDVPDKVKSVKLPLQDESISLDFTWVEARFAEFCVRDMSRVDSMVESLKFTFDGLGSPVTEGMDTAKSKLGEERWRGRAAEEVRASFLEPFPKQNVAHLELVVAVGAGLAAYRKIWEQARVDLVKIADSTLDALDNLDTDGGGGLSAMQIVAGVTGVLAAAAGIAATIATGGAAAPMALGIISGSLSLISGAASLAEAAGEDPKVAIQGDSVEDIMDSMTDATGKLWETMTRTEKALADAIRADVGAVGTVWGQLLPIEPAILNGDHRGEFVPESVERRSGS